MTSPPILETERLILRRLLPADAPELHRLMSDPAVMRYWSSAPHKDLAETESWVAESVAAMGRGEALDLAVLLDGKFIGRVAFWMGSEIGFLFEPASWGKGLAREALSALLTYGFETLGYDTVRADADPENAACLTLLERLGFVRTGFAERTFCIDGRWTDSVYLALYRDGVKPPPRRR